LLLLVPVCSWAQFAKGNKFIGGSISINNQNNNVTNPLISLNQNILVSPSVGFFVKDNIAVGFKLGYSKSYQEGLNVPYGIKSTNLTSWSGGLFIKRYASISEKFFFALEGSVIYARGTLDYELPNGGSITGGNNQKFYNVLGQVVPSFIYFPSEKWGIEASLGSLYFTHSYNFTNETNASTFNLNYGSFSLGFAYYIR
jgi:hypothetical protein